MVDTVCIREDGAEGVLEKLVGVVGHGAVQGGTKGRTEIHPKGQSELLPAIGRNVRRNAETGNPVKGESNHAFLSVDAS